MSDDLQTLSRALASEDPAEREDAAQQLAELREQEAAGYLQHALDDESEGVRMWGAYGLALLMRRQDRDALLRVAKEDESPLVRLWATFGLAAQKEPLAAKALCAFLDDESLEIRSNTADALVSLDDPSPVLPHLEARLKSDDPRVQAWAAGVLHALEHPSALSVWRHALLTPESRVDAAAVAPYLQSPSAARDLLRLLGELAPEELDEVTGESEAPLAEVLSRPLPELGLEDLIDEARTDAEVRGELLLVLLRGPAADPDVISQIHEFAAELAPAELATDVATLLQEQEQKAHPELLARLATAVPDAVEHAVAALDGEARNALFDAVADSMKGGGDRAFELMPLLDVLRTSRFAEQFEDVPDMPELPEPDPDMTAPGMPAVGEPEDIGGEPFELEGELGEESFEDDLSPLIERLAAGEPLEAQEKKKAEGFLLEIGMTAEEYVAQLNAEPEEGAPPPSAAEVAQRALAMGALLRRSELERRLAAGELPRADAQKQVSVLKRWLDEKMLLEVLTPLEADLLDTRTGEWSEDDRLLVDSSADALLMMLWALGKAKAGSVEEPVAPAALLKLLPLTQDCAPFVEQAKLKPQEEISRGAELWETWAFRVGQEDQARAAIEDPSIDLDLDVNALIGEIKKEGFDEKAAAAKGKGHRIAEALRFIGKKAAANLVEEKLVAKLVAGDLAVGGKAVSQLTPEALDSLRLKVNERSRALTWITAGGPWDAMDDAFDDFGGEEG